MKTAAAMSRRTTLKLLAGQMALLAAGCSRPREEIVPYVRMPEGLVPGVPLQFATTLDLGGFGRGVLCTSVEGRPIKVEGNPLHPASLGATDVFAEAAVLSLYDPDRSQAVRHMGDISNWATFLDALQPRLEALAAQNGAGLRILTGPLTSLTLSRQIGALRQRLPALQWHVHDPLFDSSAHDGAISAFGRPLTALQRWAEADVVVSLDADPLGPGPMQIVNARGFSERRQVRKNGADPARLYSVESTPTLTGANADHRLVLSPAEIGAFVAAISRTLGAKIPAATLSAASTAFSAAVTRDLVAHRGRAFVVAGPTLSSEVHALCHWINAELQAPIDYFEAAEGASTGSWLPALVRDLNAGKVQCLLVLHCNPAYDAPPALGFAQATAKAEFRVHLGGYFDESAGLCQWHIPELHILETWSDFASPDGTASVTQPLIAPLYETRSVHELLAALTGNTASGYQLVRETWAAKAPADDPENWWRRALEDGVIPGGGSSKASISPPSSPQAALPASDLSLTLVLRPDPCVYDGSYANNAWLQELPKPLTKEVWGNSIGISPEDAAVLGVAEGDLLRLSANGGTIAAPARIAAGHAPRVLSAYLGHGRLAAGAVGTGVGANAYLLRADAAFAIPGVHASGTGEHRPLAQTQQQFALEGDPGDLFRSYPFDQFLGLEGVVSSEVASFFPVPEKPGPQWGMTIDTTVCIGCNACVVACQVENNSSVVGPDEIARGRDMHWLRVDAYEIGAIGEPRTGFQPVPCMHCETAPCEPVCPTGASVHDSEGLNLQVYNRCVGTRFCEANCPYKVRQFNFFGYADGQEYADLGTAVMRARNNPDVTVRSRGVMEKCTYCIQRITRVRRAADREGRAIADGEVVTACQSACPTKAIVFGDLAVSDAQAAALKKQPQHYALLAHLDTKPRTSYLAQVRNLNPDLARKPG